MIERNSMNVTLHDVDPTALRQLIDYAYTGEITITEDNVQVYLNRFSVHPSVLVLFLAHRYIISAVVLSISL